MQSQTAFLILRSSADLPQASAEVAALLRNLEPHTPGINAEAIKSIWVDDQIGKSLPTSLRVTTHSGEEKTIQISETVGISGIWALCWLDGVQLSADELSASVIAKAGTPDKKPVPISASFIAEELPELRSA